MKVKRLYKKGFTQVELIILIVFIALVGGTGYYVYKNKSTSHAGSWTYLGLASIPQDNQTIAAYACTDKISSIQWKVEAIFALSNSYKSVNGFSWMGGIVNNSSAAITNYQAVYNKIPSTVSSTAIITTYVNPKIDNSLAFSYSAGTPVGRGMVVTGNIATGLQPNSFGPCQ